MLLAAFLLAQGGPAGPSRAQLDWAKETWESAGRPYVGGLMGLRWDDRGRRWVGDSNWQGGRTVSAQAYYVEPVLTPVLALSEATQDTALLNEVAGFYLAALSRFETLGELRRHPPEKVIAGELDPTSDSATRVLPWWSGPANGGGAVECQLCQIQFLYPAARAVRLVRTFWPAGGAPAIAQDFVRAYLPLLIDEHLMRLGYVTPAGIPAGGDASRPLVEVWEGAGAAPIGGDRPWISGFRDRDLWLVATASELLAVPGPAGGWDLLRGRRSAVRRLVVAGERRLRAALDLHPGTADRAGRVVGSVGFGEGMWDGHPDFRYAGDVDTAYPLQPRPPERTAWDMSHLTRLPVALRALWDTRAAAGTDFPDTALLAGLGRQYAYVAYAGEDPAPRFRNFFDGNDGWLRVGYAGRDQFGYPPSTVCDSRTSRRPCVGTWAGRGWGLIAFASPAVDSVQQALLALATSADATQVAARDRMYSWNGQLFAFSGGPTDRRSLLLMALIAELALGQHS